MGCGHGASKADSPSSSLSLSPSPSPSRDSPSLPHVIELEPVISYPVGHVNAHVRLPEAAPSAHEAPAVVVEAATSMGRQTGSQVGNACQAPSMVRMWMTMHERGM